ncbi:hypothetical protein SBY92_003244 [Candida maltosa Xu316]
MTNHEAIIIKLKEFLTTNPTIPNWLKWKVILSLLQIKNSTSWANFLSLNKSIKQIINHSVGKPKNEQIKKRLDQLSNLISCVFLYQATIDNRIIPKDYLLVYFIVKYIGELKPPSRFLKKLDSNSIIHTLYDKKEFIIFPLLFSQILSNYLTPTRYKLNQKYLSGFIKRYILNPIWINYKLGINYNRVNWVSLFRTYVFQNAILMNFYGFYYFKTKLLDKLYEIKHRQTEDENQKDDDYFKVIKNYIFLTFHKSNSLMNFTFGCNLISILLISLTSPIFKVLTPSSSTKANWIQSVYLNHIKSFFKSYTKIIGFIAGFVTLYINTLDIFPAWGYTNEPGEKGNIRKIDKSFIDQLNLYVFRLILLSKWRIVKFNHPLFVKFSKSVDWNILETFLMSFGIWKIMNFNDLLKHTNEKPTPNLLLKLVNYIM